VGLAVGWVVVVEVDWAAEGVGGWVGAEGWVGVGWVEEGLAVGLAVVGLAVVGLGVAD
jgi:hypothetical protein